MPDILILSHDADRLAALISPSLPAGFVLHPFPDTRELPPRARRAEIALAEPGRLLSLLDTLPKLRWVQSTWAGVRPLIDHPRRDYCLTGVQGIFSAGIREYVLGWMLALERQILLRAADRSWRAEPEAGLAGKTIGILGTGFLGRAVAEACTAFATRALGLNTQGTPTEPFARCYAADEAHALAAQLDYLVCLLPDTPDTRLLVNAALLAALPAGAVLINAGRAGTVDHEALAAALQAQHLGAAVLDVLPEEPLPASSPLWAVDNLYITSHTAAPTRAEAIVEVFKKNLTRFQAGEVLMHEIDFRRGY